MLQQIAMFTNIKTKKAKINSDNKKTNIVKKWVPYEIGSKYICMCVCMYERAISSFNNFGLSLFL